MKNSKGITLIALVITIIVLAMLAGVAIYYAMNGDVVNKAKKATEEHKVAAIREELTLIITNAYMDDNDILNKDYSIIEDAFNKYVEDKNNKITVPNFEWTGRVNCIDAFYKGYIAVIDKTSGKIIEMKKVNFGSNATGKSLDGKTIDEINAEAKTVSYRIEGINETDSHNVLYSSYGDKMVAAAHNGSGEYVWPFEEDDIKLAAEAYCGDNIMIYDGESNPYVPVMVRFYRQMKGIVGIGNFGGEKLGLEYFAVDSPMTFSTVNENNNWAFVDGEWTLLEGRKQEVPYDYAATSDRQCSSVVNGGTSFSDRSYGHYYASGRLTYTGEPTSVITNLGPFTATLYDSKCNVTHTFTTGSNYVIDGRRYYEVLEEGQELLNNSPQNAKVATEYHALARAILEATEETYHYNDPGMVVYYMEQHIDAIQKAMQDLNNALSDLPHISDEVLATVRHAQEVTMSIPTIEVTGGNKIFYTSHEVVTDSGSTEAEWTYDKVPQNVQIYCATNVLIYDGTDAPYVPVMAKYYRKYVALKSFSSHGLSYLRVNQDTMQFSTCNDNNDWALVDNLLNDDKAKAYDYEATSDKKYASNQTSSSSFKDIIAGDRWSCGRLTYTGTPTQLLTDLGKFRATSADENGNNIRNIEAPGNNYVIDVTIYYNKVAEAQQYLTMDNLYNNLENTYALAQLINEQRNIEYNQTSAQGLANALQSNIDALDHYIDILK